MEFVMTYFKVIYRHLPVDIDENKETPQSA